MLSVSRKTHQRGEYLYFLELAGETAPRYDPYAADVLARRGDAGSSPPAVYEYAWTIGQARTSTLTHEASPAGSEHPRAGIRALRHHARAGGDDWQLDQAAHVKVNLLFPRPAHWRVLELATSVKYLPPGRALDSVADKAEKDLAHLQPLIGVAGAAANAAGALGAGPLASATGHVLDAVAKTKINSVPPSQEFPWWVEKTTAWLGAGNADTIADGLIWTVPTKLMDVIGTRVSGTVAVSFAQVGPLPQHKAASDLQSWVVLPCAGASSLIRIPEGPDEYASLSLIPEVNEGQSTANETKSVHP